ILEHAGAVALVAHPGLARHPSSVVHSPRVTHSKPARPTKTSATAFVSPATTFVEVLLKPTRGPSPESAGSSLPAPPSVPPRAFSRPRDARVTSPVARSYLAALRQALERWPLPRQRAL